MDLNDIDEKNSDNQSLQLKPHHDEEFKDMIRSIVSGILDQSLQSCYRIIQIQN